MIAADRSTERFDSSVRDAVKSGLVIHSLCHQDDRKHDSRSQDGSPKSQGYYG